MNMRWHQRSLRLCVRAFGLFITEDNVASGFARRSLSSRVERCEKSDQGRGLRRTQILPICRHVSAALDHLADELVLRQSHGNAVQSRTTLSAALAKRMAVAALLDLENERTLTLKRSRAVQKFFWHWITAPSVHVRAPRRIASEMGECSQHYGDQQDRQNSDWPPAPTLFSFSRKEWQQTTKLDNAYGANEESWRLHGRRQV